MNCFVMKKNKKEVFLKQNVSQNNSSTNIDCLICLLGNCDRRNI